MTAVTDQDHTEHADQHEAGATGDDERESDTAVERPSDNALPGTDGGRTQERPAEAGGTSAAGADPGKRTLWKKLAKRDDGGRTGDGHARGDVGGRPARGARDSED
ncbi:hypothetical protein SZN_24643, partial [Streptomyces zinciresistens K42]